MKDVRSRGWCFTIPNYTDESWGLVGSLYEEDTNCTYLIIGEEVSPRTQTPHLQCYVYYTNAVRFTTMKNMLMDVHLEPQKCKLNVQAYAYCMEDYNYIEFGNRPRQGHRSDLEVIKHDLLKKKDMKQISLEYFSQWCQYRRSFDEFVKMHNTYNTQLYLYDRRDPESIKKIYEFDLKNSLVIENEFSLCLEMLHKYYSRRYEYIFYPATTEEMLQKIDFIML